MLRSLKMFSMKPINYFEQEGFLIVSKKSREEAGKLMSSIMKHYPPILANIDDHSLRKYFEVFYAKLKNCYPDIFLMDMYGINYLWQYIEKYYESSKKGDIAIKDAAIRICDILSYLDQFIPCLIGLDEMPTVSVEKETAKSIIGETVKKCTQDKNAKKVESGLSLVKDACGYLNGAAVKSYYTKLKEQLDKESVLKNNTRCEFENVLYQKCLNELEKCNEVKIVSVVSGINNVGELVEGYLNN